MIIPKNLYSHEKTTVRFFWALRFLMQTIYIISWTILASIFINNFGFSNLPYLFLIYGILYLFGGVFSGVLFLKLNTNQFVMIICFFAILSTFSLFFVNGNIITIFFMVLIQGFFYPQINIGIQKKIETYFSPNQAQRIMPILESSFTFGTIMGSVILLQLLYFFSLENIFIIQAFFVFLILVLFYFSHKILNDIPRFHLEDKKKHYKISDFSNFFKNNKFIGFLFLFILLQSTLFTIIEFNFIDFVNSHNNKEEVVLDSDYEKLAANFFNNSVEDVINLKHKILVKKSLAHDIGIISLIIGLVSLLFEFILASRILKKLGIINTMIMYFFSLFFVFIANIFHILNMNFVRGIQHGMYSTFETPYHINFYSIHSIKREKVRYLLEAIIRPVGIIFGSIIFLFFVKYSSIFAIIISLFLVLILFCMKNAFTELSKKNLEINGEIHAKLHAIETLSQNGHQNSVLILAKELIKKEVSLVAKEKIIKAINKLDDCQVIHYYLEILSDKEVDNELKQLILESILKFKDLKLYWEKNVISYDHFLNLLNDFYHKNIDEYFQKLVVMNFFVNLPIKDIAPFFKKVINNEDDYIKSIGIRSCKILNDREVKFYIKDFLQDKNVKIKSSAIISLWQFYDQQKLTKQIKNLLSSKDIKVKISAIYTIGEIGDRVLMPLIKPLLKSKDLNVKLQVLVAMAKMENYDIADEISDFVIENYKNDNISIKILRMLKRAPKTMINVIKKKIDAHVSKKISKIFQNKKIVYKKHLLKLKKDLINELKYLYQIAERHDDICIIESLLKK